MSRAKPVGAILFRVGKGEARGGVYGVAKWREATGRRCYRRVGRAWMEPDGAGGWPSRACRRRPVWSSIDYWTWDGIHHAYTHDGYIGSVLYASVITRAGYECDNFRAPPWAFVWV
ncbi:MAG: hypothetical protein JO342_18225 [Solirubrobacterales bacterium]|nr:hypothetical protein [Solirubrobacterales bacterium]